MALTVTNSTKEPRSFSIGPLKCQIVTLSCVSGDTSGTITADRLKEVFHIVTDLDVIYTAAPTFSGNVATIAFTDPAANRFGTAILIGR